MGSFSETFRERSVVLRAAIALLTVYCAAALFGAAGGLAHFVFDFGAGILRFPIGIVESVWAFVWGLTFLGYFIVLWPLAYLNHSYIATAWAKSERD